MPGQGQTGHQHDQDGQNGGETQGRSDTSRGQRRLQNHEPERIPLLGGQLSREPDSDTVYSCVPNPHSHLPVYTNIHRIRRDVISIVEDYMSLEQLRDVRINISVIRPLVSSSLTHA